MQNDRSVPNEFGLLTLQVEAPGAGPRVVVAGELDALSGPALHNAVNELLRQHQPSGIEINLRDVSFLDSRGINVLLACHADAQRAGCRLTVANPHPMAFRVLEITGLLDYLGVSQADEAAQTSST